MRYCSNVTPHSIPFVKAHGLGNDFLLVQETDLPAAGPGALAARICNRHCGVGADGLVVLGASTRADASYRIYNSDGSEAGLSGNGLRCAAAWLRRRDPRGAARFALDTKVGLRELYFLRTERGAAVFRAEIGRPSFRASDVPFCPPCAATEPVVSFPLPVGEREVPVVVLSMGNPQCITFVQDFADAGWLRLGEEMERHPYFPDRANIGFVRVLHTQGIEARFWERGAGHTPASGTGSCACAVAAHLSGRTGRKVTVALELGEMEVFWREDGMVELTGPAQITAEGSYLWPESATGEN